MKQLLAFLIVFSFRVNGQVIITIAGGGMAGLGDNGSATAAQILTPGSTAFDTAGNFFIADATHNRIRKVNSSGVITTIAGNGISGYGGDGGAASTAKFSNPSGIAVDQSGNLYIADCYNYRIRKVSVSGIVSTYAGNGTAGISSNGALATATMIGSPTLIFLDEDGNLYANGYHNIIKITPSGFLYVVAGTGVPGFSGDGGPATAATLNGNEGMAVDSAGNLYIADHYNNRIRKVDAETKNINTIAGSGSAGYSGDFGLAIAAELNNPWDVKINNDGEIYISDYNNNVIRKIATSGIITTIAGNGIQGFSGDNGLATSAELYGPYGITLDVCGSLYIADGHNNRIRKVIYPPVLAIPTINIANEPSAALLGTSVTVTATVSNAGSSYLIRWFNHAVQFATTITPSVTYIKGLGTDTITARVVSTAAYGCYDSTTSAEHVVTDSTSSVEDITAIPCSIWPNPISSELHIYPGNNSKGQYAQQYKIISAVGAVMLEGPLHDGDNSMPIAFLPSGIYMVEVQDPSGFRTVKKIIKQ